MEENVMEEELTVKRRWEPFRGNVGAPWPVFLAVLATMVLVLALAVLGTAQLAVPKEEPVFRREDLIFDRLYQNGSWMILESHGEAFAIRTAAVEDEAPLRRLVDVREQVSVRYTGETGQHRVQALTDRNGEPIIQETKIALAEKRHRVCGCVVLWAACLMYWLVCLAGNYILCHAQKYRSLARRMVPRRSRNF